MTKGERNMTRYKHNLFEFPVRPKRRFRSFKSPSGLYGLEVWLDGQDPDHADLIEISYQETK